MGTIPRFAGYIRVIVDGQDNLSVGDGAKCDVHCPRRWGGVGDDHFPRCLQQSQSL